MGYLISDGVNDVVSLPAGSTSNVGTTAYTWWIKGTLRAAPAGIAGILGTSSSTNSSGFITSATLQLRVYSAGSSRYNTGDNFFIVGEYHHYRLEHDAGGAWRAYRDDMITPVASGTFTTNTSFAVLNQMFRSSSASAMYTAWDMEEMGITSTTFSETYQANLSGGTGSILRTASGNNNGTLVNFPTDGSQWGGFGATYTLTADGGSWSYSGGDSALAFNRKLIADGASWSYQGVSAQLAYNRVLSADGGSYTYTGGEATLTYTTAGATYTLTAEGGSWTCAGGSASLAYDRVMQAEGGAYQYSGCAASLLFNRVLTASGGSWSYALADVNLRMNRVLVASGGAYAYSGGSASLTYSGSVILQINGYTVSYGNSATSAAFGASPVAATYGDNLVRAEYGNV